MTTRYLTETPALSRSRNLTLTLVAATFVLVALVGIHQVSPGVVFAKLQSDAAVYLAQAKHLWVTGTAWNFSLGDGLAPIVYSPVSCFLRAPLFGLTQDATTLVRLVQYENVALLLLLALVSRQYLILRLEPQLRAWSYVPFVYLLTTYNPWALNGLLPLGDHVYALLTLGAMVLSLRSDIAAAAGASAWKQRLAAIALSGVATFQKFTGIGLLAYTARVWSKRGHAWAWITAAAAVELGMLAAARELFSAYVQTGVTQYVTGKPWPAVALDSAVNLVVAAIPNQVLPNFSYLMSRDFTATHAVTADSLTLHNLPWILVGLALTSLVAHGCYRERRRLQPELLLLLVCIPVYAIATNSTSRYLASVQPVTWLLFLSGMQSLLAALRNGWRIILPVAGVAALAYCSIVAINISRSFTARSNAQPTMLPSFINSLGDSFESLQARLVQINREDSHATFALLSDEIRWYPLADVSYIAPTVAERHLCGGQQVLTLFACDARNCQRLERERQQGTQLLGDNIESQTVYHSETPAAQITLNRLHLRNAQLCEERYEPARGP